jgi:hypothetical protein
MKTATIVFVLTVIFSPSSAKAQFAKVDFRAHGELNDYVVVFCTSERGAESATYIATVTGNQKSGYTWDELFGKRIRNGEDHPMQTVRQIDLQQCADQSLSAHSQMLVISTDSTKYASVNAIITAKESDTATLDRYIAVAKLLDLREPQPTDGEDVRKYVSNLVVGNALTPGQAGLLSGWIPTAIRPLEFGESKASQADTELETGIREVPRIRAKALKNLYQALADAEDKPWNHYDIELEISETTVVQTTVRRTVMVREPALKFGESACIYINTQRRERPLDLIRLVDSLLTLSFSAPAAVEQGLGIAADHPLLGVPRTWVAISASPQACYWAMGTAGVVAEAPLMSFSHFGAMVMRTKSARFPSDPSLSNSKTPDTVPVSFPSDDRLTYTEAKRARYSRAVSALQSNVSVRSSSFAGLSSQQIQERKKYRISAASEAENARVLRDDFATREYGWNQYINNKNLNIRNSALAQYEKGIQAIYTITDVNSVSTSGRLDLRPRAQTQEQQYKKLADLSSVKKSSDATAYISSIPIIGTVCANPNGPCGFYASQSAGGEIQQPFEIALGEQKQKKFNNVVDIGVVTSAEEPKSPDAVFGTTFDRAIYRQLSPPNPANTGGTHSLVLKITNTGPSSDLKVIYAGARLNAYWNDSAGNKVNKKAFQPDESADFRIDFFPAGGYEDLNIIYLVTNETTIATITVDYSATSDPLLDMIEVTSGNLGSGLGKNESPATWVGTGAAPYGYSLIKVSMWLTGDRHCNAYSKCAWQEVDNSFAIAWFNMQGHERNEGGDGWEWSEGHLRALYQLDGTPPSLR